MKDHMKQTFAVLIALLLARSVQCMQPSPLPIRKTK